MVAEWIESIYMKYYDVDTALTKLEFEQVMREDALFKLQDSLKLCK